MGGRGHIGFRSLGSLWGHLGVTYGLTFGSLRGWCHFGGHCGFGATVVLIGVTLGISLGSHGGPFGGHFGVIFVLCWGHFGVTFGALRGHFRVTFGALPPQDRIPTTNLLESGATWGSGSDESWFLGLDGPNDVEIRSPAKDLQTRSPGDTTFLFPSMSMPMHCPDAPREGRKPPTRESHLTQNVVHVPTLMGLPCLARRALRHRSGR